MTISAPASPKAPPNIMSIAASASARCRGHDDALAGGEPVGLDHDRRAGGRGHRPWPAPRRGSGRRRRSGMPCVRHKSLVKPLEPSRRAAARLGPKALMPAASRSSTMPAHQRRLGPDDDEIDAVVAAKRDHRRMVADIERQRTPPHARCPHCPGRRRAGLRAGLPPSSRPAHARARRSQGAGRSWVAAHRQGCPSSTAAAPAQHCGGGARALYHRPRNRVSNSQSLSESCRHERAPPQPAGIDRLRTRRRSSARSRTPSAMSACAARLGKVSYHSHGPRLFRPQGRSRLHRRRHLAQHVSAHQAQARGRPRSRDYRASHHLSRALAVPDRGRDAGAGRPRRAHGAARGAQAPARRRRTVRRGAKAAPAFPARR